MPRKVLIISYYWPPSGGAGVQRWLKFVKYLRAFDWEPVVYAPLNPEYPALDDTLEREVPAGVQVVKSPIWEPYQVYKRLAGISADQKVNAAGLMSEKKQTGALQKLSVWLRGNFFIPDARKFWIRPSVKFLKKWLQENPIDALVSTGPPHSMHNIALKVSRVTGIPWLADFRDPWTNIDFYPELMLTRFADRKHHRQEKAVLMNAQKVVVISNSMKKDFEDLYFRDYDVITNGFDLEDIAGEATEPDRMFSIAHIGSMARSRNPENLWKALAQLSEEQEGFASDLRIELVGTVDHAVVESIEQYGLGARLHRTGYLPHNEIIRIQKRSRVLLLVINDTPNAKVILPGKFFEYMASGRPVLCIGPHDGDAAEIIRETGTGKIAEKENYSEILDVVRTMYARYLENKDLQVPENIARFSRKELTGQMAELLNEMVVKQNPC